MVKSSRKRKQRGGELPRYGAVGTSDVLLTPEQYKTRCIKVDNDKDNDYVEDFAQPWDPVCGNYEAVQNRAEKTAAEKAARKAAIKEIEDLSKIVEVREYVYKKKFPTWSTVFGKREAWLEPKYDNEIEKYIREHFEETAKVAKVAEEAKVAKVAEEAKVAKVAEEAAPAPAEEAEAAPAPAEEAEAAPAPAEEAPAAGGKRRTRKGKKSKKRSAKKSRKNCRKSAKRGRR